MNNVLQSCAAITLIIIADNAQTPLVAHVIIFIGSAMVGNLAVKANSKFKENK